MDSRIPAVIAAIAISTTACSSSGGNSSTSGATTAELSTTVPASSQHVAADKAAAQAALWKLSDFPTGWTSQPQTQDSSNQKIDAQISSCLGATVSFLQQSGPASASSPDFGDTNNDTASEQVVVQSSVSRLSADFALVKSDRFPRCFAQAVNTFIKGEIAHPSDPTNTLPAGATIGKVTISSMSFPAIGDQSLAYRVTLPISFKGLDIPFYVDLIAAQKGRSVAAMTFTAASNGFDSSMEQQLANLAVGRLPTQ